MREEKRSYILIGPGRWGSSDPWLGIPTVWGDISEAKVIVESGLKDFQVDPSQGTHFFQNITSLGVGFIMNPFWMPFKQNMKVIFSDKYICRLLPAYISTERKAKASFFPQIRKKNKKRGRLLPLI